MKKSFVLIFLLSVLSVAVNAQNRTPPAEVRVPVDSITNLITYEGVVEVPGVKANALYDKGLTWFKTFYKNPTEAIRETDSLKFTIVGKPRFKLMNPADKEGIRTDAGLVQYTITFATRDGRFKYEITEFNWKQASYFPSERWMNSKSSPYSAPYADYLRQLDQYTTELVISLKNALTTVKQVKDKDKW